MADRTSKRAHEAEICRTSHRVHESRKMLSRWSAVAGRTNRILPMCRLCESSSRRSQESKEAPAIGRGSVSLRDRAKRTHLMALNQLGKASIHDLVNAHTGGHRSTLPLIVLAPSTAVKEAGTRDEQKKLVAQHYLHAAYVHDLVASKHYWDSWIIACGVLSLALMVAVVEQALSSEPR